MMFSMKTTTARGEMMVKKSTGGLYTGSAAKYAVYVYDPRPGFWPWRVLEDGFGSYDAACDRKRELTAKAG
jgi:hypothetical protein